VNYFYVDQDLDICSDFVDTYMEIELKIYYDEMIVEILYFPIFLSGVVVGLGVELQLELALCPLRFGLFALFFILTLNGLVFVLSYL
jgi:hypothetical protein